MESVFSKKGLLLVSRTDGETNNEYYFRKKYIESRIDQDKNLNKKKVDDIDMDSKKKCAEKLLGCVYK